MPMPKPVRRTNLYNNIVQLEVCRTFSGRGMGMNITAQLLLGAVAAGLATCEAPLRRASRLLLLLLITIIIGSSSSNSSMFIIIGSSSSSMFIISIISSIIICSSSSSI